MIGVTLLTHAKFGQNHFREGSLYFNYPQQNLKYFLDHMKLQRHIHAMDALRHLLTTAQG